jgi:NAD(P)-dependent dehydrogenase (short-subunit alcohol dehydrogenase family)
MKVLITGANRGIGLEFCRQLLGPSFAVTELVACVRSPASAQELLSIAEGSNGRLRLVALDLSADGASGRGADGLAGRIAAVATTEPIDLLINNAGVYLDEGRGVGSFDFDAFRRSFEVNTLGPFKLLKEIATQLQPGARMLQVSSLMGSIGDNAGGGSYAYRSSKAALNMMTKCFAIERPEVLSLVVHPGWVQTDMGGPHAQVTVADSVSGMLRLLQCAKPEHSGRFFNYDGSELPW